MSKTIVVGVDESETAAAAARRAAELAQAFDGELHVLSAYGKFESETFTSGSEEIRFTSEQDARSVAGNVVAALRQEFPDLAITGDPLEGKPGEALVDAAARIGADIIVVGNKRVQGIARVLGSVARDVAARATCDVYVAHTHQR